MIYFKELYLKVYLFTNNLYDFKMISVFKCDYKECSRRLLTIYEKKQISFILFLIL